MVSVGMSMVMIVAATTCVAVRVGMTMFMLFMLVATTACIAMCMGVLMGMTVFMLFMLVAATTCVAMCVGVLMCVNMFMFFMLMGMSAAAISTMLAFVSMSMIMVMLILITVRMLWHMSHRLMIMVLATMAAGAALRMLAIIFYAVDTTINMLVSSYISSTITDIFEIFLHYIYHLSA